jgi:hypothetical protein
MNFTTIYSAVESRLATLLSGHKRLPNAYDVESNNAQFLAKGWALSVGPGGENTQRHAGSLKSVRITLQVTLTRQVYALASDAAKQGDADEALVGDFETVFDDAHTNSLGVSDCHVKLVSFEGIRTITNGTGTFRRLVCDIDVEYFRQ